MKKSKKLILIDGHALAFRQYYALEKTNMKTSSGSPTWAVYGFFKAIFDLLKNEDIAPDAIGVAFDVSHKTFRTETYEEYKSNRVAMPESMQTQMELIYRGLKAFNIPIYTKEGFEADDVIGTISKRACELGHKVLILTGDQDSFQLVEKNGCVKVIIPSKGELTEYNWKKVHEKMGVYPNQIIDYKALRGDLSDNIPGVKGIGEKTAVKLLEEFKTVDNVLANIENVSGKALKEKLKTGMEQAKLSKYLATIVRDVDVDFDFDKTAIELPEISTVTDFLREMQFYSFLKNIASILKLFDKTGKKDFIIKNDSIQDENKQLGLFAQAVQEEVNKVDIKYNISLVDSYDKLEDLLKILENQKTISFNIFSNVINPINFEIYGFGIGLNANFKNNENRENNVYYIPNSLEISKVIKSLKPILENPKIEKFLHDLKNISNILKYHNCGIKNVIFDTLLACYIKESNNSNDFDIQCMERIHHILPTMITDSKKNKLIDFEQDFILNYVGDYMGSLRELSRFWYNVLDEKEYKILTDIEIPISEVLSSMEINGVSIDEKYLKSLTTKFNNKIEELETRIYDIAGEKFNINSPKQVGVILFDKLGIKTTKKRGKNKHSTSAEVLNALAPDYEIVSLILDYRKYSKLKSTYTESLPQLIDPQDNRIHTTYNQTITTTGRLSSSNPNLQNIPIRTEEGNLIRQAFIPNNSENYKILSADYSQIELRLLAHVSGDVHLINAFCSGDDVHTLTASKVFEVPVSEVTKDMRYKAKAVNFGIVYGQSKYGLAKALNITPAEAESFITKYFETYPRIKDYMNEMIETVEKQGYVETIFGRKRYLQNEIHNSNAMIREFAKRAAINHPMQGSSSDLIKIAMIDFSKKIRDNNLKSKLIMQVHDELIVEVEKSEIETIKNMIKTSMELNQPLKVPLVVDINTGDSWKES